MISRLSNDEVAAAIQTAFLADACSVEFRDAHNRLSVRLYDESGNVLYTFADQFMRDLRNPSLLNQRIKCWQELRAGKVPHKEATNFSPTDAA
jgi:hypothetical protein